MERRNSDASDNVRKRIGSTDSIRNNKLYQLIMDLIESLRLLFGIAKSLGLQEIVKDINGFKEELLALESKALNIKHISGEKKFKLVNELQSDILYLREDLKNYNVHCIEKDNSSLSSLKIEILSDISLLDIDIKKLSVKLVKSNALFDKNIYDLKSQIVKYKKEKKEILMDDFCVEEGLDKYDFLKNTKESKKIKNYEKSIEDFLEAKDGLISEDEVLNKKYKFLNFLLSEKERLEIKFTESIQKKASRKIRLTLEMNQESLIDNNVSVDENVSLDKLVKFFTNELMKKCDAIVTYFDPVLLENHKEFLYLNKTRKPDNIKTYTDRYEFFINNRSYLLSRDVENFMDSVLCYINRLNQKIESAIKGVKDLTNLIKISEEKITKNDFFSESLKELETNNFNKNITEKESFLLKIESFQCEIIICEELLKKVTSLLAEIPKNAFDATLLLLTKKIPTI
jgi:hypothetical protein